MARVPVANLKGPRGQRGEQGLPGVNSVPTDEALGVYIAAERAGEIPAGIGWGATFAVTPQLQTILGSSRLVGSVAEYDTPEDLFDTFASVRSSPAASYWVDVATGSDGNVGSQAAPFKSIYKAITSANAGGVPAAVYVVAGVYDRANSMYPSVGSQRPTVDIAFLAVGGRVQVGSFDLVGTPALHGTHTASYAWVLASATRVLDTYNLTPDGLYTELVEVASPAVVNATPGTWCISGGSIYVHRVDGRPVRDYNTRVYRPLSTVFGVLTQVNVFMGGRNGAPYGFDLEGGQAGGVFNVELTAPSAPEKVIVAANSTFRYGGGAADATRGVSVESWNGLAAFFNCDASGNATDGWNAHHAWAGGTVRMLTVNCTAADNGRGSNQSCNGISAHEDVKWVDVAGVFSRNRGGTARHVNDARVFHCGSLIRNDLGDRMNGGTLGPLGISAEATSQVWCDRVKVELPVDGIAYQVGATATLNRRDCAPTPQPDAGTITTY